MNRIKAQFTPMSCWGCIWLHWYVHWLVCCWDYYYWSLKWINIVDGYGIGYILIKNNNIVALFFLSNQQGATRPTIVEHTTSTNQHEKGLLPGDVRIKGLCTLGFVVFVNLDWIIVNLIVLFYSFFCNYQLFYLYLYLFFLLILIPHRNFMRHKPFRITIDIHGNVVIPHMLQHCINWRSGHPTPTINDTILCLILAHLGQ